MRQGALSVAVALAAATAWCGGASRGPSAAGPPPGEQWRPVRLQRVQVHGFWRDQVKRLTEKWLPHCIRQQEAGGRGQELLNLVHAAKVLRGEPAGEFTGCPWSDAYIYNTIESICLALAFDPEGDPDLAKAQAHLRAKLDAWIPIVLAAQRPDGYIHSFHQVKKLKRYTNHGRHEFYVQGYFLEAGVAHYRQTGGKDRRLYDAAVRCGDHLCALFGPAPKRNWIHGHAGMGYALCRLARLANEVEKPGRGDKYFRLAKFLFDHRHTDPRLRNEYMQSHKPVVEQAHAVGHSVRATYFYTGIADLAMLTGDAAYARAADRVWASAAHRKLYITGGVGASHRGEAFDKDYELRNNGYCESCAGCGLSFWADRMHRMHGKGEYVDVAERVLYNNILGAVELSGENFFYQNPLRSSRKRYPWHGCPCCVANIPRALLAIKDRMYSLNAGGDVLCVNHYVAGRAEIADVAGAPLTIEQQTKYPWEGQVVLTLTPAKAATFTLAVRIPGRAESKLYTARPDLSGRYTLKVNGQAVRATLADGYARVKRTWAAGDRVELDLPMDVQRVHADERVQADRGRVALQRGPIVFSVESVDHAEDVRGLVLKPDAPLRAAWAPELLGGVMTIECESPKLRAVPNYARLNRGGSSQVWLAETPEVAEEAGRLVADRPKEVEKLTVDKVQIGDAASERAHGLRGERTASGSFTGWPWRHAVSGGWFSYEVAVAPAGRTVLLVAYWGSDIGNRRFAVMVEGTTLARQSLQNSRPGKFFDVRYEIPEALTRGKKTVTVRFQADPGATAGGAFDVRSLRSK